MLSRYPGLAGFAIFVVLIVAGWSIFHPGVLGSIALLIGSWIAAGGILGKLLRSAPPNSLEDEDLETLPTSVRDVADRSHLWKERVGVALFGIGVLAIGANTFVRVADDGDGHGIVEELFLGQSIGDAISDRLSSKDLRLWEEAASLSDDVADLVLEHGHTLVDDPAKDDLRQGAAAMSRRAFEASRSISTSYLAESNPELPQRYKTDFVQAMRLWSDGFVRSDKDVLKRGTEHYNSFLLWMQSKSREDFKTMR